MSGEVQNAEKPQSSLPHFAKAAGWMASAFTLALGTGMAPVLFPHNGGYILLGMAASIPATVLCLNMAALNYGEAAACRYAAKGITFRAPVEPAAPKI